MYVLSIKHFSMHTQFLGIKPAYKYVDIAESIHDLPTLNPYMYAPFKLSNPHTNIQLLNYSFVAHQILITIPYLGMHIKTCIRHKYYRSNEYIINIVISDLLDLIHRQIPECILSFISYYSLIAHYMHTCFKSNYKILIIFTPKHFDLHPLIYLSPYPIAQVKTTLMSMVFFVL